MYRRMYHRFCIRINNGKKGGSPDGLEMAGERCPESWCQRRESVGKSRGRRGLCWPLGEQGQLGRLRSSGPPVVWWRPGHALQIRLLASTLWGVFGPFWGRRGGWKEKRGRKEGNEKVGELRDHVSIYSRRELVSTAKVCLECPHDIQLSVRYDNYGYILSDMGTRVTFMGVIIPIPRSILYTSRTNHKTNSEWAITVQLTEYLTTRPHNTITHWSLIILCTLKVNNHTLRSLFQ